MKTVAKNIKDLKNWERAILLITSLFLLIYFFSFLFLVDSTNNGWIIVLVAVIASFFGIVGVIYSEKRSLFNYSMGGIHVLLYGMIAFYSAYYGDFILNIFFFFPMQFIGFYFWRKNLDSKEEKVKVRNFKKSYFYILIFGTIVFYFAFSYFLKFLGDPIPFIDSSSTTFSIFGMFLMVFGYWEQWIFWMIVNLITIVMWIFATFNPETGINYFSISLIYMWTVYLMISIIGLITWRKKYSREKSLITVNNIFQNLKGKPKNVFTISKNENNFQVENYLFFYSRPHNKLLLEHKYHLENNYLKLNLDNLNKDNF